MGNSLQPPRHPQVFRLINLMLRLRVYQVALRLLPLGLCVEQVSQGGHAIEIAAVLDAEILVRRASQSGWPCH